MIKVFVKLDSNNVITEINSDIFLDSTNGYVQIDEGEGDKYAHCQNQYLEKNLRDMTNRYNYTYVNGAVHELTEEEKQVLFPPKAPVLTLDQKNQADIQYLALMLGVAL